MTTLTLNPETRHELKIFGLLAAVFAAVYFLPVGTPRFDGAVSEALELTKWYAREHVVLCLLPAFWIAGAIAAFVSQASVMRYLGPRAPKPLAYGVGSVSGTILAVCSLHRAAAVLGHLPDGRRTRSGHGIPVLRSGDQRARHRDDRQSSRRAAGSCPRRGCGGVQRRHRSGHGVHLSSRGAAKGRRSVGVARAGGGSTPATDSRVLRRAGRHPGLRELGRCVTDHRTSSPRSIRSSG